jgi:hypothetical protein
LVQSISLRIGPQEEMEETWIRLLKKESWVGSVRGQML